MIVQCGQCGTKFRLDEAKIGPRGAKVRCAKCQFGFVVKRPAGEDVPVAASAEPAAAASSSLPLSARPTLLESQPTVPSAFQLDPNPAPPRPVPLAEQATVSAPPTLDLDEPSATPLPPAVPNADPATPSAFIGNAGLFASDDPSLPPGSAHDVQTAVYMVPPRFRAGVLEPPATPVAGDDVGVSVDLDSAAEAPTRILGLPSAPAHPPMPPPSSQDAELPPLPGEVSADLAMPVEEADLVDDADVTALASPPAEPGPIAPHEPTMPLDDPFAALSVEGAMTADGTILPPLKMAPEPVEPPATAAQGLELQGAVAARLEPVSTNTATTVAAAPQEKAHQVRGWSLGVKIVVWVAGAALLSVGMLFYVGGGHLDLSVIGGKKPGRAGLPTAVGFQDVEPVSMRSVLYPTRGGRQALIFAGTVENRAGSARSQIDVVAELCDDAGRTIATERAPLGFVLSPSEIAGLTDRASVANAFRQLAARQGAPLIQPRAVVPFTVVMTDPPPGVARLIHRVRLDKGEPVAPPVIKAPEPVAAPVLEGDDGEKAKKKGVKDKAKKKGIKGKRKAKGSEAVIAPP